MNPRPHKYGAVACERDGHHFPSLLEGRLYDELVLQREHGDVLFFLRQVPFHLPGGGVARIDFQVAYRDGRIRWIDAKGKETAEWKRIIRIVEQLYPVRIETWPKPRKPR